MNSICKTPLAFINDRKYSSRKVYFLVGRLQGFACSLVGYQKEMMTICRFDAGFVGFAAGY